MKQMHGLTKTVGRFATFEYQKYNIQKQIKYYRRNLSINMIAVDNQPIIMDNQTVISDITDMNDSNTINSFVIEDKMDEIIQVFNNEANKLNIDVIKEKAKEQGLSGLSKLKKPEIIQMLEVEFGKLLPLLKEKKINELKNICKGYGIKGMTGAKKDMMIYRILMHCSVFFLFTITLVPDTDVEVNMKNEQNDTIEQLEKQKLDIEMKIKEELRIKEEKRIENEQRIKLEAEQKKEEKRMREEADKKQKETEEANRLKEEAKKKKQSIPKNVRVIVWNHYISEDIIKHKCLCCKKVTICNTNFEVGHVISEKNGGTHEINNLRPICFSCNHSMGTENMIDFVVKYGLYIG